MKVWISSVTFIPFFAFQTEEKITILDYFNQEITVHIFYKQYFFFRLIFFNFNYSQTLECVLFFRGYFERGSKQKLGLNSPGKKHKCDFMM